MPALGHNAHAVLKRTEYDVKTGLFWYYSKSMRDEAFSVIQHLTEDKSYPKTVLWATTVIDAIRAHEESASMLAAGDPVIFVFMTSDKKAKRGDHAKVINAEKDSDTIDVALDTDSSSVFSAPRLLLVRPELFAQ